MTTRKELDQLCQQAAIGTGWSLWLQHSATGYAVQQTVGKGAQPIGECLTARECKQLLRGLVLASTFS